MDTQATIDEALARLRAEFPARFEAATTEQALRDENAKILGKKGEITAILRDMGKAPPEARRTIGEKVNRLKQEVEDGFQKRLTAILRAKRDAELNARPFDL